jgi:hypothetical protein
VVLYLVIWVRVLYINSFLYVCVYGGLHVCFACDLSFCLCLFLSLSLSLSLSLCLSLSLSQSVYIFERMPVSMYDQGRNYPDSRVEVSTCCITFVFVALLFIVCLLRVRNGYWLPQIRPSRCVESLGDGEGKESKSYPGGCQSREWRGVR